MSAALKSVWLLVLLVFAVTPAFAQQKIKAKDTVRLMCTEEPSLNKNYEVTQDGLILVPFLGAVKVEGMTEKEAAAEVKKQLEQEKILTKATVTIEIVSKQMKMVSFGGAVGLEAETPWKEGMRLSVIVKLAEPNEKTDLSKVQIVSSDGSKTMVDYTKADLQTNANNPLIKSGDKIVFFARANKPVTDPGTKPTDPGTKPPTTDPGTKPPTDPSDGTGTKTTPPVKAGDIVSIGGEVVLAGDYAFTEGMTLSDALVRTGGFTGLADPGRLTLERGGTKRDLQLPADKDFKLMSGDKITVAKKAPSTPPVTLPGNDDPIPPGSVVTVIGSVNKPGPIPFTRGMTMSQAIAAAGGFIDGAKKDRLSLLTPNNTKPRSVDFTEIELRYRGDIVLKPGQTIEVPGPKGTVAMTPETRAKVTRMAAGAAILVFLFGQ